MLLVYVSYLSPNYSRSSVHFDFLSKKCPADVKVEFRNIPSGIFNKVLPLLRFFIRYRKEKCVFVVMSPASSLVVTFEFSALSG